MLDDMNPSSPDEATTADEVTGAAPPADAATKPRATRTRKTSATSRKRSTKATATDEVVPETEAAPRPRKTATRRGRTMIPDPVTPDPVAVEPAGEPDDPSLVAEVVEEVLEDAGVPVVTVVTPEPVVPARKSFVIVDAGPTRMPEVLSAKPAVAEPVVVAEPVADAEVAPGPVEAVVLESGEAVAEPAGDKPASDKPASSSRRGRGSRRAAPVEAPPVVVEEPVDLATDEPSTDDPIAQALSALGRAHHVADFSAAHARPESVLDSLVQAIAGDTDDAPSDDDDDEQPSRRRRRRGGRKRHREGAAGEVAVVVDTDESADSADDDTSAGDDSSDDSSRHHRRRRRRRGEDIDQNGDDDADVTIKVRDPHSRSNKNRAASVTGIDGSTRLEAKKQRRREGRAASRHRAPILSEAEFLARRESVERKMLIRQKSDYSQIAVIEDGVLVEHYVDRASATSLIGNIYLGKVQNVLPGMEAAFIDIGRGRNAVLYAGEVDWDSFGEKGQNRKIEDVFTSGQLAVVQVSKDPVGAKGARLTSHISIPGRYVVYAPQGHISGISRKLSESERVRLKAILDNLLEESASVVIRTAAEGASEEELVHDINRLKAQWEVIEKKSGGKQAPQLLYAEPDLTMRIVRDLFTEDFTSLIVDGNGGMEDAYDTVTAYVNHVAPNLADRIERWSHGESGDLFAQYRIDEQIAKALDRKVHLPSGGSLVIDRTEAMTVIDVNTGKFTGSGGNLEATVTSNNLEAAEEIVRQLRLRDIGGIIIVDFIDMVLPSNRELLLRRLVECLGRDRTRHQVSEVTSLGLVQLTRKKVGTGLAEAFTKVCEACDGSGYIRFDEPVDTQAPADGGERHPVRRGRRKS
ncbi:MAG: Rne/Rng family ribonuclease [Propionibacteriaceae bacterium]|jgi:ribonuclease E|nr:Rne/Rng family ribonuclease [Propionibacteriaceae bacterium]